MSKLKTCKKIKEETKGFQKVIEAYIKSLKQEYKKNIFNCKNELLESIAENEGLKLEYLKKKYLANKKKKNTKNDESTSNNDELLDVLIYEGSEYYYEDKESGLVYDNTSKVVGTFINGKVVFKS
jgi:hypothetical protein